MFGNAWNEKRSFVKSLAAVYQPLFLFPELCLGNQLGAMLYCAVQQGFQGHASPSRSLGTGMTGTGTEIAGAETAHRLLGTYSVFVFP